MGEMDLMMSLVVLVIEQHLSFFCDSFGYGVNGRFNEVLYYNIDIAICYKMIIIVISYLS